MATLPDFTEPTYAQSPDVNATDEPEILPEETGPLPVPTPDTPVVAHQNVKVPLNEVPVWVRVAWPYARLRVVEFVASSPKFHVPCTEGGVELLLAGLVSVGDGSSPQPVRSSSRTAMALGNVRRM
jgi:hypothetical protein